MNIVLVFPKSTFLQDPLVWMPLGLMYLGAQLEAQGHHCDFIDLSNPNSIFPSDGDYDQLWLSATSPQMFEVRKIAEIVRGWNKTKTVFGGAAPWANPDGCKNLPFNLIVGGESDHPGTIRQILSDAEFHREIYFPLISKNLEWVLPPLRRWALDYYSYMTDRNTGIKHRMTSMFTSRGCGKSCAFCESGRLGVIWDRLVRFEPIHVVETQIKEIADQGFTGIGFYDDILPTNKKRMAQILELTKKIWDGMALFLTN